MHQDADPTEDGSVLSLGFQEKKGRPLVTFGVDNAGQLVIKLHEGATSDAESLSAVMFYLTQKPEIVEQKLTQAVQNILLNSPEKATEMANALTRFKTLVALTSVERPTMSGYDVFVG